MSTTETTLEAITGGGDAVALAGIWAALYYVRRAVEALNEAAAILRGARPPQDPTRGGDRPETAG